MQQNHDQATTIPVWDEFNSPAINVSQGDLFYFEEEESERRYGIVVTADCDLQNKKHSRLVSLIPLLTLDDILINCLYIDHLEKIKDDVANFIFKELKPGIKPNDPSFSAVISSILMENTEIEPCVEEAAKIYIHKSDKISSDNFLNLIKKMGGSPKKAIDRFDQQIQSRGDIILLSKPPSVEHDVRIAWLRRMWQVTLGDLSLRNSSYISDEKMGQHVARLASPFRYRLTQQFAQVFSDIGTPDICRSWIKTILQEKMACK